MSDNSTLQNDVSVLLFDIQQMLLHLEDCKSCQKGISEEGKPAYFIPIDKAKEMGDLSGKIAKGLIELGDKKSNI